MSPRSQMARLVQAVLLVVPLASGCAHAPAAARSDLRDEAAREGSGPPERVMVTGSRLARPVGRDGQPITISPVHIIQWRVDPQVLSHIDPARALRAADVDVR